MTTINFPQRGYTSTHNFNSILDQFKSWIQFQSPSVLEYFDVSYTEKTVYFKSKKFSAYTASKIEGYNPEKAIVFRCNNEYQLDSNMVAKLVNLVKLDNNLESIENARKDLYETIKLAIKDMRVKFPEFNFEFDNENTNLGTFFDITVCFKYVTVTFFQHSNTHLPKMKVNSYKKLNDMTISDLVNFTQIAQENSNTLELAMPQIIEMIPTNFWKQ